MPELDSALDVVNYALADYGIRDYIQGLNLIGVRITSIGLENYHRILGNWGRSYEEYLQKFK